MIRKMAYKIYTDFTKHPQYFNSQNLQLFRSWRFKYYLTNKFPSYSFICNFFKQDYETILAEGYQLQYSLDKIIKYNPDIFIITSSFNRLEGLRNLYKSIITQKISAKISWIIIENGSTDDSLAQIKIWDKEEPWITYIEYRVAFGYATPARNRGLMFIQLVLRYCYGKKYYWVIDSDDLIHNEFVLTELYKTARNKNSLMTHGFTLCNYKDRSGEIIMINSIPRDLGNGFPVVKTLKDEFDAGPQNLASLICCSEIHNFYYPDEFTMEDDTLNQRIMLWSIKKKVKIIGINFPCLIKSFHELSMSGKNNNIGNKNIIVKLGPSYVTGIRAQVVLGLLHLRDYYTAEKI